MIFAPADDHGSGANFQSLPVELFERIFQDMEVSERYQLFLLLVYKAAFWGPSKSSR